MQPKAPVKNYLLFFASVMALVFGWNTFKIWMWPPPPPKEIVWPLERIPRDQQATMIARLGAAMTGRGLADVVDLTTQFRLGPIAGKEKAPDPEVAAQVEMVRQAEATVAAETATLGGPGYAITATMTNRGAGVQELILNNFPGIDELGRQFPDKRPLELIPHLPGRPPAFAIFHYARAEEDERRPLDTLGRIHWNVIPKSVSTDGKQSIAYATELPEFGLKIIKTFSLARSSYHLGLTVHVEKMPAATGKPRFRYQLAGASGLPIEGVWYATTYRNIFVGLVDKAGSLFRLASDSQSLSRTAGSERFRRDANRFVYAAVAVQYFTSAITVDNLGEDGAALPQDQQGFIEFARATVESSPDPSKPFLDDITVRTIAEPVDLIAGAAADHRYLLYHGPIKISQLNWFTGEDAVSSDLIYRYGETLRLSSLTDYGSFGIWTTAIVKVTNLIHWLIGFLTKFLPTGIAIMVVTVIVRGMMFPVSKRQATSMQRMQDKMQKLAPEMKEIEKKYKDDFMMKQQAQRELYRKHNVNPAAGLSGCFMLMLQMPIFMGLYYALQESAFFRLERFLWIRNLAAPDMLMWWGETIPWVTRRDAMGMISYLGPYLNLLPLIGAALIFVQQKLSMPAEMSEEQRQQYNIMKYMTGFMALMFYKVPAGLSLYFICSSLWGLGERKLVKKLIANDKSESAARAAKDNKPAKNKAPAPPSRLQVWWQKVLRDASKK